MPWVDKLDLTAFTSILSLETSLSSAAKLRDPELSLHEVKGSVVSLVWVLMAKSYAPNCRILCSLQAVCPAQAPSPLWTFTLDGSWNDGGSGSSFIDHLRDWQ